MKGQIQFGDEVKDIVTDFKGIVIARIEYMNGCIQFGVKARAVKAALTEAEYIDETQLVWISDGINKVDKIRPVEETEEKRPYGVQQDQPGGRRKRKGYY